MKMTPIRIKFKFFSDLLTTQTNTIRSGALKFANQISPLLNCLKKLLRQQNKQHLSKFMQLITLSLFC